MAKTQEEKLLEKFTEDLASDRLDEATVEKVFEELSKIEHLEAVLINEIRADRIRYFNAKVESQERIKGAFLRAFWWLKKVRSKKDKEKAVKSFRDKGEFAA